MRILMAGAIAAVLVAGLYILLRPGDGDARAAIPPPIAPVSDGAGEPIPDGLLLADARSARPLTEEGLRWERASGPDLPTLISPCGGPLASDADRVGGRQVALVADNRWKLERVVVYRDVAAARAAMVELDSALARCADPPGGPDGVRTVWRSEVLGIGDEARFVAGQRMRGDRGLPGHHRGVIMRQGRTMVLFVDFGQARHLADRSEVPAYERDAATMAERLANR
jgi:hypothetical protein